MKMFILKIHSDYGYEGTSDYSLAVSSSKERLEELANDFLGKLAKDFLEKLPKIKKKIALDIAEWDYEDGLARKSERRAGDIVRFKASEKIREDVWLSFQGDSALDFLEIKANWSMDLSEFDTEEVEVV